MRIRVGYGGPKNYRHGRYNPGGRPNNGNMTEIERLIHLIASMQILFGSRRGGAIVPLLILALGVGGYFWYQHNYSPDVILARAHAMWDSGDTKQQIKAIKQYKTLLHKKSTIEAGRHYLMDDRDMLYRRIINHEVKNTHNEIQAAEWILEAWDEGIRDLRFQDEEVIAFWDKTTASSRQKNKNRKRNRVGGREDDFEEPEIKLEREESETEKGRFDSIPGLDNPNAPQANWHGHPAFSFA